MAQGQIGSRFLYNPPAGHERALFIPEDLLDRVRDIRFGEPDCPDCSGDLVFPDCHADGCPRVGTCGQCAPFLDPPFHPDPPEIYGKDARREGESWMEHTTRMRAYMDEHRRQHEAGVFA